MDTGCAHSAPELEKVLSATSLVGIVNTHSHEDHIGANGYLQRQREGLEIRAHPWLCRYWPTRAAGSPLLIEAITLGHFSRRRLVLSYLGRNDSG